MAALGLLYVEIIPIRNCNSDRSWESRRSGGSFLWDSDFVKICLMEIATRNIQIGSVACELFEPRRSHVVPFSFETCGLRFQNHDLNEIGPQRLRDGRWIGKVDRRPPF
eukprot:1182362-Prorocentrum_minimum.AAC.2